MSEAGYTFTTDWFTSRIPLWMRVLGPLVGAPGVRYLEVGVYEGRSFCWVLDNVLTGMCCEAVAVDPWEERTSTDGGALDMAAARERFHANVDSVRRGVRVTTAGSLNAYGTRRAAEMVATGRPPANFDVVYIDGDHTAASTLEDAVLAFRMLRVGGLIGFDDCAWTRNPLDARDWDVPYTGVVAFMSCHRDRLQHVAEECGQIWLRRVR